MWDLLKYSNNVAIISEDGVKATYSELHDCCIAINRICNRSLVISLCQNSVGSIVGYVAFLNSHNVPIMLNAHMEEELLTNLFIKYQPAYIWCPTEDIEKHPALGAMKIAYTAYDYSLLETGYVIDYVMSDELALLLTTSGSTGSPKFVRQSYENIRANTESIVEYLSLDESEKPITTLPMNYTYGLSIINTHLWVGATILVTDKSLMQKEFWQFFKDNKATSFGGVPYTYEILKKLRFMRMELPSLRTMTQAGGKLIPELHKEYAEYALEHNVRFVVMYGQCEATARMGYLPCEMAIAKCGSMGIAIPGGKFYLIDSDGIVIDKPNITGELVYEGKNVTLGYAERLDDLALGDTRNGLLETGDMAQFDEDGYFYIVGRKKRFLKIYGNRVNLDEVDRMIRGDFYGLECACTGIDDHMTIYITNPELCQTVKDYIVAKTKLNPAAFNVVHIDEIPKNEAGKVLYGMLDGLPNGGIY